MENITVLSIVVDYKNKSEYWIYKKYKSIDSYRYNMFGKIDDIKTLPYGQLFFDYCDFKATIFDNWLKLISELEESIDKKNYSKNNIPQNLIMQIIDHFQYYKIFNNLYIFASIILKYRTDDCREFIKGVEELRSAITTLKNNHRTLSDCIDKGFFSSKYFDDKQSSRVEKMIVNDELQSAEIFKHKIIAHAELLNIQKTNCLSMVYDISTDFNSVLGLYFWDFINNKIYIKVCENCKRPFIPYGKAIYCNRIADEKGQTCKDVGPIKKYNQKLSGDTVKIEYYKVYRKLAARVKHGHMKKKNFEEWRKQAKKLIELIDQGKKEPCDFLEWLADSQI